MDDKEKTFEEYCQDLLDVIPEDKLKETVKYTLNKVYSRGIMVGATTISFTILKMLRGKGNPAMLIAKCIKFLTINTVVKETETKNGIDK